MRAFGQIAMLLAGAILMLHTIMPHDHHDELDAQQHYYAHETADSLIDYIKLAFHLNPGEDHLESFQGVESLEAVVTPMHLYQAAPIERSISFINTHFLPANDHFVPTLLTDAQLLLRGPPNRTCASV